MAEILLNMEDKSSPDEKVDFMCYKVGDVIDVQADGWGWSESELNHPHKRIIRVNVLPSTVLAILALSRSDTGDILTNVPLKRRKYRIDVSQLPPLTTGINALTKKQVTDAIFLIP